jgi:hypothetical protein
MRRSRGLQRRILAIDPTYRGFGYVVLEGSDRLVDWGLCEVRTDKKDKTLRKIGELARLCGPDVLVVEDIRHRDCRRGERAMDLIEAIATLAREMDVRVRCVPVAAVRQRFAELGATNKDAVAKILASQFPELDSFRPPRRRTWMPEAEQMAVFDALSLALSGESSSFRTISIAKEESIDAIA